MDENTYTLKRAGQELGVSVYAIRRLCNAGVVRGIRRNRSGYRILNQEQIELLGMFSKMVRAGFTMAEVKKFARLQERGSETARERKGMLETKKRQVWSQIQNLQEGISFMERAIEVIDEADVTKP